MQHQVIRLTHVDSTNDYAKRIVLPQSSDIVILIRADSQSAGKGQRGNTWESEADKNFTGSFCCNLSDFSIENRFYLSKTFALAAYKTLIQYSDGFSIKWPNDLLHGSKKVGGILIETVLSGSKISSVVAGIGINLNQTVFPNLVRASSLKNISGKEIDLNKFEEKILTEIMGMLTMLNECRFLEIDRMYYSCLYLLNKQGIFKSDSGEFTGRIRGTNLDGSLIVQTDKKIFKNFDIKEIEFLFEENREN